LKKILVIGCGGAGMFSSIVATQLKPKKFKATILSDEKDIYCRCSTPYIITDKAKMKEAIQPDSMITGYGVNVVKEKALRVDTKKKKVFTDHGTVFDYDLLVLSTGAAPFIPPIEGAKNAIPVRSSDDVKEIIKKSKKAKTATIIGAGVIGIEMASALNEKGIKTSLMEFADRPLAGIASKEYSEKILKTLEKNKIEVYLSSKATRIGDDFVEFEKEDVTKRLKSDLVILASGVRANIEPIKDTPIKTNKFGILVDDKMRTNIKNVYACGDCAIPKSHITHEHVPSQLASSAIQQAKIVGYQIAGFPMKYGGSNNAFAFQFLGKEYAGAGISEENARKHFRIVVIGNAKTTDVYKDMNEKEDLDLKLVFAGPRLRLVGVEAFGKGTISHVETASFAITMKNNIFKLMKYNYIAHPSLTPWPFMNPLIMGCEDAMGKVTKKLHLTK